MSNPTDTVRLREISVRLTGRGRKLETLRGPEGVARFVRRLVAGDAREHFVAIYLDNRHAPIGYRVTSIGTVSQTLVHPREIFQPAYALGASALLVAHNHPSGNPEPSAEDRAVTRRLAQVGRELAGVELLDHVVVGATEHRSLRELAPELVSPAPHLAVAAEALAAYGSGGR